MGEAIWEDVTDPVDRSPGPGYASLVRHHSLIHRPLSGAVTVVIALAVQTAILAPLVDEDAILPIALAYLLIALAAAAVWGWAIGMFAAVAANLVVNFFFVPPLHTLTAQGPESGVALVLFLAVSAIGATMLALLRRQAFLARAARRESEILLSLSNEVALGVSPRDSMARLCEAIARALHASGCAIIQQAPGWPVVASTGGLSRIPREEEALAAQSLVSQTIITYPSDVRIAGVPSRSHLDRQLTYVPLPAAAPQPGVLRLHGRLRATAGVDAARLLAAFAGQASVALHRTRLQEEAFRIEALQRADEFKAALLSSVSHDLRSPLMAIRTSVESLLDESVQWSAEDRQAFLDTIHSQSDRLSATVTNLLELSRLEGGAVRAKLEPIPVSQLFEEVALGAAPALNGHVLDNESPEGLAFRGDWALAVQSVTNLVENAAKYSTPGAPIHLTAERAGFSVLLRVADEGPGIPPADLPHIFEKFFRGSAKAGPPGSGLGLSIVKAMVELSGGHVAVESSSTGTTFTLSLTAAATRP